MVGMIVLSIFYSAVFSAVRPARAAVFDTRFDLDLGAVSAGGAAVEDLDGDFDMELLIGTGEPDPRVMALHHSGDALWSLESPGPVNGSVTTADLDDDGTPEVTWGNAETGEFHVARADGTPLWTVDLGETLDAPRGFGDVDGDGQLDVVVASCGRDEAHPGLRAYAGASGELLWAADTWGCYEGAPLLFDQDGDQDLDVVVSTWFDAKVRAFSGHDGTLRWEAEIGDWSFHSGSFGDLNDDGVPDVVLGDYSATVWALDGATGAILWSRALEDELYVFGPTAMGDLDGDGGTEIVVTTSHATVLDHFGNIQYRVPLPDYCLRGPVLVDFDGDGLADIVAATSDLSLTVLAGNCGRPLFTTRFDDGGLPDADMDFQPSVWDLDDDGVMEIFTVYGRGWSKDVELNWGRAILMEFGGSGPGWPTFLHDHHNSSNYASPPGAMINDPDWPYDLPTDTGDSGVDEEPRDTGGPIVKPVGCGCASSSRATGLGWGLLSFLVLWIRRRPGSASRGSGSAAR